LSGNTLKYLAGLKDLRGMVKRLEQKAGVVLIVATVFAFPFFIAKVL